MELVIFNILVDSGLFEVTSPSFYEKHFTKNEKNDNKNEKNIRHQFNHLFSLDARFSLENVGKKIWPTFSLEQKDSPRKRINTFYLHDIKPPKMSNDKSFVCITNNGKE